MEPILLTINEVARLFGMHPNSIRKLMGDGRLPFLKIDKSLRFETDAVMLFIEKLRKQRAKD